MKKISQRQKLLNMLMENKELGVNSYDATYKYSIKQAPTRIFELKEQGFEITKTDNKDGSVNWVLEAYPPKVVKDYRFEGNKAIITERVVQERLSN